MASAPQSIRTDMISWLSSWLSACEMLSTSLVARLRTSPPALLLEVRRTAGGAVCPPRRRGGRDQRAAPPWAVRAPWTQLKMDVPTYISDTSRAASPACRSSKVPSMKPSTTTSVASPRSLGAATLSATKRRSPRWPGPSVHLDGRSSPRRRDAAGRKCRSCVRLRACPSWLPASHGCSSRASWDAAISR